MIYENFKGLGLGNYYLLLLLFNMISEDFQVSGFHSECKCELFLQ